jgi:type IV pilus assembly protein PilA
MGKQQKKRGFTIVELVIVIGVIGILAGILVPTFISLNKRAQDSSDTSFAKNANTALAMGHHRHKTMSEAIADVVANSDISVDDFKSSAGNILVWDSEADRFAIVDEAEGVNKVIYAEGGALKATKNAQLFRIYDDFDYALGQRYSIYASKNWNLANAIIGDDTHPLTVGFDVGINDHFVSGRYERASDVEAQSVILNTGDCAALAFEVDSPKDTLSHFGSADNIHITAIASASYHEWGAVTEPVVIESGRIVLESGSDVTATVKTGATAEKSAGSASSVEYEGHTPSGSLTAFRFPAFVQDYLARTDKSRLDSILDIQSTPNPNRSNFYRNDEEAKGTVGGADVYMIGNDNSFAFPLYAIGVDSVTLQETVYKNPSGVEPVFTRADEHSGAFPSWANGTLDATACTAGDQFTITLGGNVLTIKIVDGYNITDAKGLSLFDNVSALHDENGATIARYDKWADKKKAIFGDEYYSYNPAALIQHGDIKLKNTDLPDDLFWSAKQVDAYLRERPGVLTAYTNARNAGRATLGLEPFTELDVKRNLAGSMRDDIPVFYRATGRYLWNPSTKGWNPGTANEGYTDLGEEWNGDFEYHGNYFTIDASALKQIAFFGTKEQSHNGGDITPETGEPMPELNPEVYSLIEGSHGTLFGFNTVGGHVRNHLLPYRGNGGQVDVYNLAVVGNGNRANDTKYQGGLFAFKVDATVANFHNVNIAKAMGSFMSQIGWYKQNAFKTELHVDRCKSFDSYSSMFYIYGTEKNYLTNSCCKNAGGPLIMLDERNRYLEAYEGSGAGDHCGFVGDAPTLDCTNV